MPMPFATPSVNEMNALRNLEAAVRACGLPHMMIAGGQQLEALSAALQAIENARNSSGDTNMPYNSAAA